MKQITFRQYRNIDLIILTVLMVFFETITTFASSKWFAGQPVALSISLAIICVTMMRWNGYAAVLAVAGGFAFCAASGATPGQYVIYCAGNVFSLAALGIIRIFGKEQIRADVLKLLLFGLTAYLGMVAGRGVISLLFGGTYKIFVVYAATDIMSLVFAEVILILLRKSDGMIEDQKSYLLRLDREKKKQDTTAEPGGGN